MTKRKEIMCSNCEYAGNNVDIFCKGHYAGTDFELALKHGYVNGCLFGRKKEEK